MFLRELSSGKCCHLELKGTENTEWRGLLDLWTAIDKEAEEITIHLGTLLVYHGRRRVT